MAQVSATVVGCPAGWGKPRREQYAALIESAGFPNVRVVPEPRAAFLYARHARGLRIDAALMQKSAMVIDIGSSTTDFAYVFNNSLGKVGHTMRSLMSSRTNNFTSFWKANERVVQKRMEALLNAFGAIE